MNTLPLQNPLHTLTAWASYNSTPRVGNPPSAPEPTPPVRSPWHLDDLPATLIGLNLLEELPLGQPLSRRTRRYGQRDVGGADVLLSSSFLVVHEDVGNRQRLA